MRVFVTGATGFIGSATVKELIAAGHKVLGLSRSDDGAKALLATGADVHHGHLQDLDSLRSGAAACDGVIHLAFIQDFLRNTRRMARSTASPSGRSAMRWLARAARSSSPPAPALLAARPCRDGGAMVVPAVPGLSRASPNKARPFRRWRARRARRCAIRLPPSVHGDGDKGFVPMLIAIAREKGVSAYIGDGSNRWPAVHRFDAAHLYRLVLEKGVAGARLSWHRSARVYRVPRRRRRDRPAQLEGASRQRNA